MTNDAFHNREQGFEAKFSLDQETDFKVNIRRDRLLGQWAAGQMNLGPAESKQYAEGLVNEEFQHPGEVAAKVLKDLEDAGVEFSDHRMEKLLVQLTEQAEAEIRGG